MKKPKYRWSAHHHGWFLRRGAHLAIAIGLPLVLRAARPRAHLRVVG